MTFVTWLWGDKYSSSDVFKLVGGIRRNTRRSHKFVVFTDDEKLSVPENVEVYPIPNPELADRSCFCRLRVFDPDLQRQYGLGDKIVSVDLDDVIVGNIDPLFDTSEEFMVLKGANAVNPNPFNCSLYMLRAGSLAHVWRDFTVAKAKKAKYHEFPDDQGWIWHVVPRAGGWTVGASSGIYGFKKPGWPVGTWWLPPQARIVAFIGSRKPRDYEKMPWLQHHWRA